MPQIAFWAFDDNWFMEFVFTRMWNNAQLMACIIYAMFLLTDFRDVFNKTWGVEFNSVKFDQITIFLPKIGKENLFAKFGKKSAKEKAPTIPVGALSPKV